MTSKFSRKHALKTPPVCHASLIGLGLPYQTGSPNRMAAIAHWVQAPIGIALHETFSLARQGSSDIWRGSSSASGPNLEIIMNRVGASDDFRIALRRREGLSAKGFAVFRTVPIPPGPPWDSGILRRNIMLPDNYRELHIID